MPYLQQPRTPCAGGGAAPQCRTPCTLCVNALLYAPPGLLERVLQAASSPSRPVWGPYLLWLCGTFFIRVACVALVRASPSMFPEREHAMPWPWQGSVATLWLTGVPCSPSLPVSLGDACPNANLRCRGAALDST